MIAFMLYISINFVFIDTNLSNTTTILNEYGFKYALEIIINNLKNFFQYLTFFFISPVLVIVDIFIIVYQIWLGINVFGGEHTFILLFMHGIIEFPNMVLYMLLSLKCMVVFYKKFNLDDVFIFMKDNYKLYILSIINIILAGLIEGMIHF